MRAVLIVVAVAVNVAVQTNAEQARGATRQSQSACALLTDDLIAAHSPASKDVITRMLKIPKEEDKAGAGTGCAHGDVYVQLDPFPVANFERAFAKWTPVAGVGDRAAFRDNQGMWAELALVANGHMITIQMDVPKGRTSESIKSNVVGLAKALVPKLKG